jgi:beta-galactosidase GanA
MTLMGYGSILFSLFLLARPAGASPDAGTGTAPALRSQGTTRQLVVDGRPFLMLGGELGNSTASSAASLDAVWPKLQPLHLNTVLSPVYWELIEPTEGKVDFSSIDRVINQARQHHLHVVLLWFGSWKNSMSSYAPAWVKRDVQRFPRVEVGGGRSLGSVHAIEIVSPFSDEGRAVDARVFAALMRHLRQIDGKRHTVLLVQVENEVAMVEDAADRSAVAQRARAASVPKELLDALAARRAQAAPPLAASVAPSPGVVHRWVAAGARSAGTWSEVFGDGDETDELFIAWHFARYVDAVTRAGKAEYPLPMYVNAALNRPGAKPGQYNSGGPLPHLYEVWRAGAPAIDFLAPDIYLPNFADWTGRYTRADNPLFVPEARNDLSCAVKALYAIGAHQAMGFSPFAIESLEPAVASALGDSYRVLAELTPQILAQQGLGTMTGVLLDKENPTADVKLGDYRIHLVHDYTWEWSGPGRLAPNWPVAGAVIINSGAREYTIAGNGIIATFAPDPPIAGVSGIERIEEGSFQNDKWVPGRRLNGDENHQGRHLRLPAGSFGIQKIWLYRSDAAPKHAGN